MEELKDALGKYWPLPPPAVALAAAFAWWVIGYLPWLVAGLEDATRVPVDPNVAGRTAVPLYVGSLALLVVCALVGGVGAGLTGLLAPRERLNAAVAAFAGTAAVAALMLLRSAMTVRDASTGSVATENRLVTVLVLTAVGATLVGWVIGALALVDRALLGLAIGVIAGAMSTWLGELALPFLEDPLQVESTLSTAIRWSGSAVLVVALVLVGTRPAWRLLMWPIVILAAWLTQSVLTTTFYVMALVGPDGRLGQSLDQAWKVFWDSSSPEARHTDSWITAIVVAAVIALTIEFRNRRSETADERAEA